MEVPHLNTASVIVQADQGRHKYIWIIFKYSICYCSRLIGVCIIVMDLYLNTASVTVQDLNQWELRI